MTPESPIDLRAAFQSHLGSLSGIEPHLEGSIRHALQHPGNMIRAELAYHLARIYDLERDRSEALAIAIEYFHTASLLFDDLPSMDNASQRRGATCVHRSWGEGAAILAALAFINRAYGLLWQSVEGLPGHTQTRALKYVEKHLGVAGLLNGQSQDLHFNDLRHKSGTRHQRHQQIAIGKTVSLIRLPLVLPAMLGGAPPQEVCLFERLSVVWGLCYQILDDLKDVLHAPGEGGKTVARDAELNRPNLALTIGLAASFRRVGRLMKLSDRIVSRLSARSRSLMFLDNTRQRFQKEMETLSRSAFAQSL
jgi:geranylgeranyl pyrophosphate synthase